MFRKGGFIVGLLAILLLAALLVAGGIWLFQAGQAQGYALGMAAAAPASSVETAPGNPAAPGVYPGYPGWMAYAPWHFGFFPAPFLGLLCLGALFFFFLFAAGGLFRMRYWGRHPGHWHGPKGGPGPWGPPPWAKDWETRPPSTSQAETSGVGEQPVI